MTSKSEVAIQCCKKILVNICSVFCRNLIYLLINGLIFFQDSDFLGCGEKEETNEERSRALVSTSSPRGITRFVLSYLMVFLDFAMWQLTPLARHVVGYITTPLIWLLIWNRPICQSWIQNVFVIVFMCTVLVERKISLLFSVQLIWWIVLIIRKCISNYYK